VSFAYGECGDGVTLYFFEAGQTVDLEAGFQEWGGMWDVMPHLEVWVNTYDADQDSWIGSGGGTATYYEEWNQATMAADDFVSVTIDAGNFLEGPWGGSVSVVGGEWDLQGEFTAIYCANQDMLCP
jgi:hypothetical protein